MIAATITMTVTTTTASSSANPDCSKRPRPNRGRFALWLGAGTFDYKDAALLLRSGTGSRRGPNINPCPRAPEGAALVRSWLPALT
jgi:hypothetical protein